jgi:hypothetical protein
MNLMNAFSTPWLNLSIGLTMGYSLDQLPSSAMAGTSTSSTTTTTAATTIKKGRERLPTEPGPGHNWGVESYSSFSSATPSSSNATLYSSNSVTASLNSVSNSMGGYASPLSASPIKSPPSVIHHNRHIDNGDELDPVKSK